MHIVVYTDGSCPKPHGPGGWGYIVKGNKRGKTFSKWGYDLKTTNQRMELQAALEFLKDCVKIKEQTSKNITVDLYSDSNYLVKGCNEWCHTWVNKRWKNSSNEDVKNLDLWKDLYKLSHCSNIKIDYHWVKGHSGNFYNEKADELAGMGTREAKRILLDKGI